MTWLRLETPRRLGLPLRLVSGYWTKHTLWFLLLLSVATIVSAPGWPTPERHRSSSQLSHGRLHHHQHGTQHVTVNIPSTPTTASPIAGPQQSRSHKNRHTRNRPPGRHVCIENNVVTKPVKQVESYCKPIYKSHMHPCQGKDGNKFCTTFRVMYERAYRTVLMMTAQKEDQYSCCPGWARHHPGAISCNKPVCTQECRNGGTCTKPDHCLCAPGWSGKTCENDVDECKHEKNNKCEQKCVNTHGSYRCECFDEFLLLDDGRTCKININSIPEMVEFMKGYEELSQKVEALDKKQGPENVVSVSPIPSDLVQKVEDLTRIVSNLKDEVDRKFKELATTTTPPPTTTSTTTTTTPAPTTTTTTTTTEPPTTTTTTTSTTTTTTTPPPTTVATPSTTPIDVKAIFDENFKAASDRIESLSAQISMLEERLEYCSCNSGKDYSYAGLS